ncbi:MAG: class I SAM-dependent methyltransferase [Limnohabitans sp.]
MSSDQTTKILDHFTKTALAFGTAPQLTDAESLNSLLSVTNASSTDRSLDVACGAGVVTCHFARTVQFAEGVDITPAMLDQARARQEREQLNNVRWTQADVAHLPFTDASFTVVTSRYAIHHMESPLRVLNEMKRVCAPGGRIAVADICLPDDAEGSTLFDRIERLNDPSHVHALTASEWLDLFACAGLATPVVHRYILQFPLVRMLQAASRSADDIHRIEKAVRSAAFEGQMAGIVTIDGEVIHFCYPIAVLAVTRSAA